MDFYSVASSRPFTHGQIQDSRIFLISNWTMHLIFIGFHVGGFLLKFLVEMRY